MRIVASQEIAGVGTCVSDPAIVDWHWYYHAVPASPWALIALLLVIPKANHNRQAWLILIPLVVVLLLWSMLTLLFGMAVGAQEQMGCLVMSAAIAWAAVWLLGHWLGSRYSTLTFFSIMAVMVAVAALTFFCCGEGDGVSIPLAAFAIYYGVMAVGLVAAMMLAGRFCRKRFSGMRFGLWLLLWMPVVTVGLPMLIFLAWIVIAQDPWPRVAGGLIAIPMVMTIFAGILYLFNLPFLILGAYSTFYRRRLEAMFRVKSIPAPASLGTTPFAANIETEGVLP
ncbi:MAG: hypothetical protein WCB27_10500 [Thermoguttaceae bacterium]